MKCLNDYPIVIVALGNEIRGITKLWLHIDRAY